MTNIGHGKRFQMDKSFLRIVGVCCVLCLIPFACFSALFMSNYMPMLRQNEQQNQESVLESVTRNVETTIKQMIIVSQEMSKIPELRTYSLRQGILKKLDALDELRRLNTYLDTIDLILLFVNNTSTVYASNDRLFSFTQFQQRFHSENMNGEDFLQAIFESNYQIMSVNRIPFFKGEETNTSYIGLALRDTANTIRDRRAIMLLCSENKLKKLIQLDDYSSVLLFYGAGEEKFLCASVDDAEAYNLIDRYHSQDVSILSRTIPAYGLTVLLSYRDGNTVNVIYKHMQEFLRWTCFLLIISGLLIAFAVSRLWRPINKLRQLVQNEPTDPSVPSDAYNDIQEGMTKHIQHSKQLTQRLQTAEQMLSDYYYLSLLLGCGNVTQNAIKPITNHSVFCVALVRIIDNPAQLNIQQDIQAFFASSGRENVIANIIPISSSAIALVCNYNLDNKPILDSLLDQFPATIQAETSVICVVGIGKTYTDIESLNRSYIEALRTLDWHMTNNQPQVIRYESLNEKTQTFDIPFHMITTLESSILDGNIDTFARQLDDIKTFLQRSNLDLYLVKCFMYELLNTLIRLVNNNTSLGQQEVHEYMRQLSLLPDSVSIDALMESVEQIALQLCEYNLKEKNSVSMATYKRILEYVQEHACDMDFTIARMADDLGMAFSSLRFFFKKYNTLTLSAYIEEVRMRQAQQLLAETNYSIKDIAARIGYSDATAFIRRFHLLFNCTPGNWRALHKKKKDTDN